MRDAQVSIALRKGCPVDGNSVQKRSKSDECDFGRHDTYSSSGCAVAQEISLTYLSGLPRCFLGTWIYARPDRVGRKREVPVMAIRPATEVVNSCRKIAAAEETLVDLWLPMETAVAALSRAREADRANDRIACEEALAEVRRGIGR